MKKTKFIIVGLGNRGLGCFAKGLRGMKGKGLPEFAERAEVAALVDSNLTRGRVGAKEIGLPDLPVVKDIATAQKMVNAEWCIITTPDYTHCETIIAALKAGLNVLVDKPLATSAWECDRVIAQMKESKREVRVGHNMRYLDYSLACAKLIRAGRIGEVISVEAAEILDYSHGGDYYHRWHSDFSKSAGLMNHKCCHHLDVLNWILDDDPIEVSASGGRGFYRPRPDLKHAERCEGCEIAKECPHYFDIDKWDGVYRRMYREAEGEDGYVRDLCVFSDRHTINDYETLRIRYKKGTLAGFSLVTFAPREFWYFYFTGTKGRAELGINSADGQLYLRVTNPDGKTENIDCKQGSGEHGHGGADIELIADTLGMGHSDPLQRAVPAEARRAVLIADLAARSIAAGGRAVKCEEAGKDFPPPPPLRTGVRR
jgi:predicted dehydrogenase